MPIFVYPSTRPHQAVPAEEFSTALTENVVWVDLLQATPTESLAVELALATSARLPDAGGDARNRIHQPLLFRAGRPLPDDAVVG